MTATSHRVTTKHIAYLAAAPTRADGNVAGVLADTDRGIGLVTADAVLVPGSGIRRVLMTRTDLAEDAAAAGMAVSEFVRANARRIAAELNDVIQEG